jgi:magnesium transporter
MGGHEEDQGPATPSRTRLETSAPDNGTAAKPSKSSKRRKNRNRKRRKRQESFLTPSLEEAHERSGAVSGTGGGGELMEGDRPTTNDNQSYFQLRRKPSSTSLESDALLDHR